MSDHLVSSALLEAATRQKARMRPLYALWSGNTIRLAIPHHIPALTGKQKKSAFTAKAQIVGGMMSDIIPHLVRENQRNLTFGC